MTGPSIRRTTGWLSAVVLTLSIVGCTYNGHTNMGMTEKWIHSDVNIFPRIIGSIFTGVFDSVFSPFTAAGDYIFRDGQYHPNHEYLSYAGSRTLARSDMAPGWRVGMSFISIPVETVWLVITLPIDLITILCCGTDESPPEIETAVQETPGEATEDPN